MHILLLLYPLLGDYARAAKEERAGDDTFFNRHCLPGLLLEEMLSPQAAYSFRENEETILSLKAKKESKKPAL